MPDLPVLLAWPPHGLMAVGTSAPALTTAHTLDATADDMGWVFRAHKALTFTHVVIRVNTITGTPGTLRVGLQGVSATTGLNSGTYLGSGAAGYADITSYGTAGFCLVVALGVSVTVARGDLFCVYLKPQATGTWDASNSIAVTYSISGGIATRQPYAFTNGAKVVTVTGVVGLRTASESIGYPVETLTTYIPTSATNPGELGLKLTLQEICDTYQIVGLRLTGNWTANRAPSFYLYDTDGSTPLQSLGPIDTDQLVAGQGSVDLMFDEATLATLQAGSAYRLTFQPAATSAATISTFTTATAGDLVAIVGEGAVFTYRNGITGSWTDVDTQAPCLQALISNLSVSGSGGLSAPKIGPGLLVRA